MKKLKLFLIALLICSMHLEAQQRSESEAIRLGQSFLEKTRKTGSLTVVPSQKISDQVKKKTAFQSNVISSNTGTYVINDEDNHRFVIVSADQRMHPILGWSQNGSFDADSVPEGLLEIIEGYNKCYEYLKTTSGKPEIIAKNTRKAVQPLITTKWDQGDPYNAACPIDPRFAEYADKEDLFLSLGYSIRSVTGCVATAMAQVMNYHKYPPHGAGSISYSSRSLNIPQSMDFSKVNFDWANMANTYEKDSYTEAQKNAIATLMHSCGNSVIMDYAQDGSGAFDPDLAYALREIFGYNQNLRLYSKNYFNSAEWEDLIHTDLENGRPIIYTGVGLATDSDGNTRRAGHAFVLDGCDSDGMYHINWGYSGRYDGYFTLEAMNAGEINYNLDHSMVCNIAPQTLGESEDLFIAESYTQSDLTDNSNVGSYAAGKLNNFYCYSVKANTYDKKFEGEVGVGLFDANRNFIKSLGSMNCSLNAGYGYREKSFSIYYDRLTFTEGSKYNIAPYAKAKTSSTPTPIRTTIGLYDAYNVEVKDGKVMVNLGWMDIPEPVGTVVEGNYTASAFNFSDSREDWTVNVSQEQGTNRVWITNIDPIAEPNAAVYGDIASNGTQIRIPAGQKVGAGKYLYNYSSVDDIIVYVSAQDSTMSVMDTWGTVDKTSGQTELSKYSSTVLRYAKPTPEVVEAPVIIVSNRTLNITCPTEGANIYYTIGGATPDQNSIKYANPVALTDNRIIKAIAVKGSVISTVAEKSEIHEFKVSAPVFSENANKISISVADPSGATIYYTTDGSVPTTESSRYTGSPIVCNGSTTFAAFAVKDNWDDSDISEYTYTFASDPTPAPDYELVIENLSAGELDSKIPEGKVSELKSLWLSGDLNGTDIKLIRRMATTGELKDLNIQNTRIVSGGQPYYVSAYSDYNTQDNVIGEHMFDGCAKLISLILPNRAKLIESSAFEHCDNLKDLTVPASCEEIKMMSINFCKRLEKVSLPSQLSELDNYNFIHCPKLSAIQVDDASEHFKSIDGILFSKDNRTLVRYPEAKDGSAYAIPTGVETIGAYAFKDCALVSITIPPTVTSIESNAFDSCKELAQIDIPNSVTQIGMMAFEDCKNISKVKLSDNIASLEVRVFANCVSLQSVKFGKNLAEFDGTAFSGCLSLKLFEVSEENPWIKDINGVLYSKDETKLIKCPIAFYSSSYLVPEGVETVCEYAFQDCRNVENFTLPRTLKQIASNAFAKCSMKSINLPSTVHTIGWMAFEDCDRLETFVVPEALEEIPFRMLANCENLSYLYLPSGVKKIGTSAFISCNKLSTINSDIKDMDSVEVEVSYDGSYSVFQGIDKECVWNVPEGSESTYTSSPWWISTWKIVPRKVSGITSVETALGLSWHNDVLFLNPAADGIVTIYDINGVLVKQLVIKGGDKCHISLPKGIYIMNGQKMIFR